MNVTAALEEILTNTEPMSEDEILKTMRVISRRAWDANGELAAVVDLLGDAHGQAEDLYNDALDDSYVRHPERRVEHHRAIAKKAASEQAAMEFALTHKERKLHRELEILDRLATICQSMLKATVAELGQGFGQRGAA